jgi:alpha/beta superfamily hydrolase
MNNQIVYNLFYMFVNRGFSVLRFNFRGVGRSQGQFDHGAGELSDAAAALDWAQASIPRPEPAGSPASPSAPGSACSS